MTAISRFPGLPMNSHEAPERHSEVRKTAPESLPHFERFPPEVQKLVIEASEEALRGGARWLRVNQHKYQLAAPFVAKGLAEEARKVEDFASFQGVLTCIQGLLDHARPVPRGAFEALNALSARIAVLEVWLRGRAKNVLSSALDKAKARDEAKAEICAEEFEAQKKSDSLVERAESVTNFTNFQGLLTEIEATLSKRPDLQTAPLIALAERILGFAREDQNDAFDSFRTVYAKIPKEYLKEIGPGLFNERRNLKCDVATYKVNCGEPVMVTAQKYGILDSNELGVLGAHSALGPAGYAVHNGQRSIEDSAKHYQINDDENIELMRDWGLHREMEPR